MSQDRMALAGQPRSVWEEEHRTLAPMVRDLLVHLGQDVEREGLRDTPTRVAVFLAGFLTPQPIPPPTVFDSEGMDEMIVIGPVPFYSLCEHHLLPFFGSATLGYVPNGKIVGLSKVPRMVQAFARGLQNQERITQRIATMFEELIHPRGVGVVLSARHLCMEMRGVCVSGAVTTTSAMRGVFLTDAQCRREFLGFQR